MINRNFVKIAVLAAALAGVVYFLPAEKTPPRGETTHGGKKPGFLGISKPGFKELGAVSSGSSLESVAKPAPTPAPLDKKPTPSLSEIKKCLRNVGRTGDCLDKLFGGFYDSGGTTGEALAAARKYEAEDTGFRYSCHPVMHAIGRETFKKHPTVQESFQLCDQTCHSGCYHGAMERFLRGDLAADDEAGHVSEEEITQKAASACDPNQPIRFRFQCLHGLGHALQFFLDYKLEKALYACDSFSDQWSRSSCYGGVFMENVFSATPEKRDLSRDDYHYPCNKLDKKYKYDCYAMQTSRMSEMGLSTEMLFRECAKAGDEFRLQCMKSIGRDLSNDARTKDPGETSKKCEIVTGEDRKSCITGAIYALIDNTWDGKYAFPFCAGFKVDDASFCFQTSAKYMRDVFAKSNEDIKSGCRKYLSDPRTCYLAAAQ